MANGRVITTVQDSTVSDFATSNSASFTDSWTSVRKKELNLSVVDGSPYTLSLAEFTTVEALIINNTSASSSVVVAVTNAASAAVSQVLPYGETLKLTDVKIANGTLTTSSTVTQTLQVIILGS